MRIVAISDTHWTDSKLTNLEIPDGDVLIHAGDATMRGECSEMQRFMDWFGSLPHRVKLFTAGNHDWAVEEYPLYWGTDGVKVLTNQFYDFEFEGKTWHTFGTPWTRKFNDWAFNVDEEQMGQMLNSLLPCEIDIMISHGPAYGILDSFPTKHTNRGNDHTVIEANEHLGLRSLRMFVNKVKPKLFVCGHIHSGHGIQVVGPTTFVNAALLGEDYKFQYMPVVIDL